jgi:2,4-dienoyl-CoA reductase-like NADH-dependent reductase (Old Yellow Enzyme family)
MDTALASLFEPLQIGGLAMKNRIAMAPMTRSFSPRGIPGPDVAAYYRRRADGGAGLIITEGTYVGHEGTYVDSDVPLFAGDEALAAWKHVTAEVHSAGAKIIPQLWHVGLVETRGTSLAAQEAPRYRPELGQVGPSGLLRPDVSVSVPMTIAEIDHVIEAFATAAVAAKRVGFDGIELHGAHGYLIDQFFWPGTNQRTDRYGASYAGRGLFAAEIISETRRRVGTDFPILLRISQWKQQDYSATIAETPEDLAAVLQPSVEAGVDMFHCSQRRFWEPAFAGSDLNLAGWVRKLTGKPTMTVGSVGLDSEFLESLTQGKSGAPVSLDRLLSMLAQNQFDMVAIGRGMLSDPEWAQKVGRGDIASLKPFHPNVLQTLS